jgi:hypothetical protein
MSVRFTLASFAATGSLVALLAACAGNGTPGVASPTVTTTETNTVTVTSTPSASPSTSKPAPATTTPAPKSTFAFDKGISGLLVHNSDGSEYLVQVKLGPILTNAKIGTKVGKFKLGSACSFNSSTDVVMGLAIMASSHTPANMAVWNLDVRTTNSKSAFPVRMEQFVTNTGNLNCTGGDQAIYQYGGSFSSDGYREIYGAIIIHGYKTSSHPKTTLAHSPLRFKVIGTVIKRSGFGSKQSDGYYTLPLG